LNFVIQARSVGFTIECVTGLGSAASSEQLDAPSRTTTQALESTTRRARIEVIPPDYGFPISTVSSWRE